MFEVLNQNGVWNHKCGCVWGRRGWQFWRIAPLWSFLKKGEEGMCPQCEHQTWSWENAGSVCMWVGGWGVCMCICMAYVCLHVKVRSWHPVSSSIFLPSQFFRQGLSINLEISDSAGLAVQWAQPQGSSRLCLPRAGITGACCHACRGCLSYTDWTRVLIPNTLPAEASPHS